MTPSLTSTPTRAASAPYASGVSPWPAAQPNAPWRASLAPAVAEALALPGIAQIGGAAVDVVVVGAGIAGLSAAWAAS
ncbi:MAG TPA: hypothetical protein VIG77_02400, partial [Ktedonobacterales bacterium]